MSSVSKLYEAKPRPKIGGELSEYGDVYTMMDLLEFGPELPEAARVLATIDPKALFERARECVIENEFPLSLSPQEVDAVVKLTDLQYDDVEQNRLHSLRRALGR